MTHGSLFSGIGGFDLASEWMGWENVFHCEWSEFGKNILNYYWPNAKSYGDIDESDFTIWRGKIDILSGGFPCQPYSHAGKRKGKEDDRHKWPQMLRAVREIQPRWIVGENVYGLINWSKGLVFEEVQVDLENEGYEVTSYILPACSVNAEHKRDRIWFIAHASCNGHSEETGFKQNTRETGANKGKENKWQRIRDDIDRNDEKGVVANSASNRQSESGEFLKQFCSEKDKNWKASWSTNDGGWPTESPVFTRTNGFPAELDTITISDWIDESNKAGGNAIVPQVAMQIFQTIEQYEQLFP